MEEHNVRRRPLKRRERWWSRLLLAALLKTSLTPNQVSVGSMGFACMAAVSFIFLGEPPSIPALLFAIVGMQGRLLCNLMDGMLAIEGERVSPAGEFYNEIPDRVSDVGILIGAGYGCAASSVLGIDGITLGWIASMFAVLTAYVRVFGVSVGAGQIFLGPMAKPHRMALLTATCMIEIILVLFGHSKPLLPFALMLIILGCIATLYRRQGNSIRQLMTCKKLLEIEL